jgi:hypothetical protein
MGISAPNIRASVTPYTALDGFTSGSMEAGMSSSFKILSSHFNSLMLKSMVREALL